ncbi:MAG: tetratricopeptide repeat protein, partial [Caldilineaceae bacterium]|nr:tetratricopeptide repeat protein [Caldilineaceae bacterium]
AAAILRLPFPISSLMKLVGVDSERVTELLGYGFLTQAESEDTLLVPPCVIEVVRLQTAPIEQQMWHTKAATYYQTHHDYIEAAYHWYQAQEPTVAADLLLVHAQALINRKAVDELADLLTTLQSVNLPQQQWARLRLLAGQVAELLSHFETATTAYTEALRTPEPTVEAEAHYRLARILEYRNLDEALVHYTRGIDLLERHRQQAVQGHGATDSLLAKLYIHCSWIFIQGRQDLQRADSNLQRAKLLIDPQNRTDWADLYNAGGELAYREGNFAAAVASRMEAWLAAKECNDVDRMVKITYNLGRDYTALRQFEQALSYLETSRQMAQSIGMRNLEAGCRQIAGDCYFYQGRYGEALIAFQDAYQLYHQLKNYAWLVSVCYDLAATYALLQQWDEAQRYYQEGITTAHDVSKKADSQDSLLLQKFEDLRQQHPRLTTSQVALNPRQQNALAHVDRYGEISNRVYRQINGVENKTAAEDLKALVVQGLLAKIGQGAATRYRLPAEKPSLSLPLSNRQQEALAYLRQHGHISNRIYRNLTQVGNKAAAADLRDLVEMGLVKQQGKGPATIYRLV